MVVLKCTMCGGDLEVNTDLSVGVCQYCGSTITIPKQLEKLGNLFNRANALRQNNEFDKAIYAYEDILKEDYNDAEAHWGLVLCKYGIEYVEDPNTGDRVPTCHRLQYDSILLDSDYQTAINQADGSAKVVYESEARRIDRIQKRILEISAKEDPFDIFICYKETDEIDCRSEDSVIAQEMYYELTKRGFKVFYARKTLEGKLGNAYEPLIFAALNSAKAMVVLGTKPGNFNAVWVKNEWSRYRDLIKKGQEKTLIPAFRGFSAYELPVEFSNLQALDMTKLGFMHDLIDGLEKIVSSRTKPIPVQVTNQSVSSEQAPTESLIKRAYIFLEDGDFQKADEYFEKALDHDPEASQGYWGKLLIALEITHESQILTINKMLDGKRALSEFKEYQKAFRFGSSADQERYESYDNHYQKVINEFLHNEAERRKIAQEKEEERIRKAQESARALTNAKSLEQLRILINGRSNQYPMILIDDAIAKVDEWILIRKYYGTGKSEEELIIMILDSIKVKCAEQGIAF